MQFMFEQENVFWDEVCYSPETYPECIVVDGGISCPDDKPVCEQQYSEFSSIFIWFTLSSSLSVLVFVPLQQKFGNFVSRFFLNLGTTSGLILLSRFCIFVKSNSKFPVLTDFTLANFVSHFFRLSSDFL